MRKLSLIISLTFVSFAALAWGGFEHAVIAYMAMEHLTPDAERNIRRYLDQPLYEYADWMDYEPIQYSEELGQLTRHSHLFTVNPDFTYAEESLCSNGECNGAPTLEFLVGAETCPTKRYLSICAALSIFSETSIAPAILCLITPRGVWNPKAPGAGTICGKNAPTRAKNPVFIVCGIRRCLGRRPDGIMRTGDSIWTRGQLNRLPKPLPGSSGTISWIVHGSRLLPSTGGLPEAIMMKVIIYR